MSCKNCGGDMLGDGYTAVLLCENLSPEESEHMQVQYMAPDEGPIYCSDEE